MAKVVIALRERSVPIIILPTGGSNNIARAFGITASLKSWLPGWQMPSRVLRYRAR